MLNKLFSKVVKFLILIFSGFRRNQKIISDLIVWLNIQQGRNAPVTNEMEVRYVKEFLNVNDDNVILDVGAHKGTYTDLIINNFKTEKILMFEPQDNIFKSLKKKYENNTKIIVDGEEDLATLAVISLSKIGAKVIYGMPDRGMVVVDVDQQAKKRANDFLNRMLVK